MQTYIFEHIPVKATQEAIYKRLGFREGKTKVSVSEQARFKEYLDAAHTVLRLKGVALRIGIVQKYASRMVLENNTSFDSKLFSATFKDCAELLFMAVTAGGQIIELIQAYEKTELTKSVVYDAAASEVVDAAFDWMQNYFIQAFCRESKKLLRKRISCGYADFSILYQQQIFDMLDLKKIGVAINKDYLLIPEKSATAVTGIC